jgi:hypothetical protein
LLPLKHDNKIQNPKDQSITKGTNEQVMIFPGHKMVLVHPVNNIGEIRLNNEIPSQKCLLLRG